MQSPKRMIFLVLAVALVAGGCSHAPASRFYALNSLLEPELAAQSGKQTPGVWLGPVRIGKYLDRPQIVTRTSSNAFNINETQRWVGSLKNNFTYVLATNLMVLLQTDNLAVFPAPEPSPMDFRITMDVYKFDGSIDDQIGLISRWSILDEHGETRLTRTTTLSEKVETPDYAAYVTAGSILLDKLSREISSAVLALD